MATQLEILEAAIADADIRIGHLHHHIEMLRGMNIDPHRAEATLEKLIATQNERLAKRAQVLEEENNSK